MVKDIHAGNNEIPTQLTIESKTSFYLHCCANLLRSLLHKFFRRNIRAKGKMSLQVRTGIARLKSNFNDHQNILIGQQYHSGIRN